MEVYIAEQDGLCLRHTTGQTETCTSLVMPVLQAVTDRTWQLCSCQRSSHLVFECCRNYDGLPALFLLLATVLRQACHVFLEMVLQQLINLQQQQTTSFASHPASKLTVTTV